jgi:hypothetical protein
MSLMTLLRNPSPTQTLLRTLVQLVEVIPLMENILVDPLEMNVALPLPPPTTLDLMLILEALLVRMHLVVNVLVAGKLRARHTVLPLLPKQLRWR